MKEGQGLMLHVRYLHFSLLSSVPSRPLQPSLIFVGKAMSLPKTGAPERCFTCRVWSYTQTSDQAGKDCQTKTIANYEKSYIPDVKCL
jgi:hypothetical protein